VIVLECVVPPVVVKVLDIEEYAIPDTVEYLQVADSLVVKDMVVWFVPAVSVPVGWEFDRAGAVASEIASAKVLPETILDKGETLFNSSAALIAK
jgi:hypothetical protein